MRKTKPGVVQCSKLHMATQGMVAQLSVSVPAPELGSYLSVRWLPAAPSESQEALRFFVAVMIGFVLPNSLLTPGQAHSWKRWFSETLLKLRKRKSHRKYQSFTKYIPRVIQFPNPKSNTVINSPPVELRCLGRSQKSSREIEESIYASGLNFR